MADATPGPSRGPLFPLSSRERRPATPRTSELGADFISFDFGDDDEDEDHLSDSASPSTRGSSVQQSSKGKGQASGPVLPSGGQNGKRGTKRGFDQVDDDSHGKKRRKKAAARKTPWAADVDWGRCKNPAEMLHREMVAFTDWLSPTPAESETRILVIELIRRAIVAHWPDADVRSFGSQNTELYLPQGDIDLVVMSEVMATQARQRILPRLAYVLRAANLAHNVQVIAKAKVPIVKFVCLYGRYNVDISLNQSNGIKAATIVNRYLKEYPALRPLCVAIKYFLNQRGMNEVYMGGVGSYTVICLVLSFLQLHPKLQRRELEATRNLGVLLIEFLELYGKNFSYDATGIRVTGNGGYFSKVRRGWSEANRPYLLSIEDPQDPTNDISKGSYGILSVRATFEGAYDMLTSALCVRATEMAARRRRGTGYHTHFRDEDEEARRALEAEAEAEAQGKDEESLLNSILGVSNDVIKFRRDIGKLWESGTLHNKLGIHKESSRNRYQALAAENDQDVSSSAPSNRRADGVRSDLSALRVNGVDSDEDDRAERRFIETFRAAAAELKASDEEVYELDEESDSRYAAAGRGAGAQAAKRRRVAEDFVPAASSSSEDEDELDDEKTSVAGAARRARASGGGGASGRAGGRPAVGVRKISAEEKRAYWSTKATARAFAEESDGGEPASTTAAG